MKINTFWKFIISFGATFLAAVIGSLFTFSQIPTWYANLNPTSLTPPNWLFGPVWTVLYIMMALALFLVWQSNRKKELKSEALILFFTQLALNSLWSILFFGGHLLLTSFVEIIILLIMIILTTIWFFRISKIAGWLMVPYIIWVSFASILNLFVFLANTPR